MMCEDTRKYIRREMKRIDKKRYRGGGMYYLTKLSCNDIVYNNRYFDFLLYSIV